MNKNRWLHLFSYLLLFLLLSFGAPHFLSGQDKTTEISIEDWLLLGPFSHPFPEFLEDSNKEQLIENLIKSPQVDRSKLIPIEDHTLRWHDGTLSRWRKIQAGEKGISLIGDEKHPTIAYFAAYLDVKRWTRARITIHSPQAFNLCVDGIICITKSNNERNGDNSTTNRKRVSTNLSLETGKHILIVKSVYDPGARDEWTLNATLAIDENYMSPQPTLDLSPTQNMGLSHVLDVPTVTGISISPNV